MATFHDTFLAALKTDIASALTLSADAIYFGRQPQRVTRSEVEVWIQPLEPQPVGEGFGHQSTLHRYEIHIRIRTKREGNLTGAYQLTTLLTYLDTLRRRYNGNIALAVTDLYSLTAGETYIDDDATDSGLLDGALHLDAYER